MNISDHITYVEAVNSETAERLGIDNIPSGQAMEAMKNIAEKVFEPLRKGLGGKPIRISSFYRSGYLNEQIGGSSRSQHCKGEAMDIKCGAKGFHYIKDNLEFDQLIWEYGDDNEPAWVHVSLKIRGTNRKQVLKKMKGKPYQLFN